MSHSNELLNPRFAASLSEVRVAWGLGNLWQVSEVMAVLLGTVFLTCEVCANSG